VDQHDRAAAAARHVVHPHALDVGELVPEGLLEGRVVLGDGGVRRGLLRCGTGCDQEQQGEY
jgi:hypothetical protein